MVNNISRNQRLIRFIIKKQIINRITSCQYPLNKYPKLSQPPLAFRNMAKKENIVIKPNIESVSYTHLTLPTNSRV